MQPAYHISLTASEKRLIAEVSALQSQIEWLMRLAVQHLLGITPPLALTIMGSTNIAANAEIWIRTVREKATSEAAKAWAEYAYAGIPDLTKGRNDFLHTLFGFVVGANQEDTNFFFGHMLSAQAAKAMPRRAIRVKTSAEAPLADLKKTRDGAARLSCVFAHVRWLVDEKSPEPSPWQRRLGSKLPPPPATPQRKRGRGRGVRRPA